MLSKVIWLVVASLLYARVDPFKYMENSKVMADFDSLNTRFIGNWPFGYSHAVSFDAVRNLVFCGSGGGVYIIDVSNPQNPIKVSEKIHTRDIVGGLFYEPSTQRLYIAVKHSVLEIWDVSDEVNPLKLGYYFTPGSAYGVYVSGSYAYVADDTAGLRIIDVSDPTNPSEAGYYDTPAKARGVYVSGSYAYVVNGSTGLQIYEFYGSDVEEKGGIKMVSDIRLFKNLVSKEIKLVFGKPLREDLKISLYNSIGQKVKVYLINKGSKNANLDVKGLSSGIYFLKPENRRLNKSIKVVIR